MAFEGLSEKLNRAFKRLTGKGKLSEKDVKEAMREVKMALLEADVNFLVVKDLIKKISNRSVGQEIMESLTPGQQVIKVVNEELTQLMGGTLSKISFSPKPPTVILMVGLQGSGKTTTSGKLGNYLKGQGKNPLLVGCDVYRPAAIEQLKQIGDKLSIAVYYEEDNKDVKAIAHSSIKYAAGHNHDVVIIDTAGRLHIDDVLMGELEETKSAVRPTEILLVVDAMTGQDAVTVAQSFNERLGIDGVILTKLDGDTRGGAALSVKAVTNKPIKFAGLGEKLDDLEPFHPDRMASRILGMGDVLSLIEKAQANIDEKKARELERKIRSQQFTFEDFLDQLQQLKNMGSLSHILDMIPGIGGKKLKGIQLDDRQLFRVEAIINSMTVSERQNPNLLSGSRKKRVAAGSGTSIQEVNRLVKQFEDTKKMMKQFGNIDKKGRKGKIKFPF